MRRPPEGGYQQRADEQEGGEVAKGQGNRISDHGTLIVFTWNSLLPILPGPIQISPLPNIAP